MLAVKRYKKKTLGGFLLSFCFPQEIVLEKSHFEFLPFYVDFIIVIYVADDDVVLFSPKIDNLISTSFSNWSISIIFGSNKMEYYSELVRE